MYTACSSTCFCRRRERVKLLPIIVVLFFFLSILEDSGYMARVAFVMDKPLRKIDFPGEACTDADRIRLYGSGGHGDKDVVE